jgi:hypothetical protein
MRTLLSINYAHDHAARQRPSATILDEVLWSNERGSVTP